MAKYDALRDHLMSRTGTTVSMSFGDVERIVGDLPSTAFTTRQFWANDSKVQARAWRAAGWHVDSVALTSERVVFAKGEVGGTLAARIAAGTHTKAPRDAHSPRDDEKFCPQCFVAVPASGVCDSCSG